MEQKPVIVTTIQARAELEKELGKKLAKKFEFVVVDEELFEIFLEQASLLEGER